MSEPPAEVREAEKDAARARLEHAQQAFDRFAEMRFRCFICGAPAIEHTTDGGVCARHMDDTQWETT